MARLLQTSVLSLVLALSIQPVAAFHGESSHWVLFLIRASDAGDTLERLGEFHTMSDCFSAWDEVSRTLPKPKINFQISCINTLAEIPVVAR